MTTLWASFVFLCDVQREKIEWSRAADAAGEWARERVSA